jgi:hypothetical protein
MASSASVVAESPKMTIAGSPGTMRTMINTTVSTAIKVGIAYSSRLAMNLTMLISTSLSR